MRIAILLSLALSASSAACSSGDSGASNETAPEDTGPETIPTCAAKSPCACGDATCAADEFCALGVGEGSSTTRTCVKFVEGAKCVDLPCAENDLCGHTKLNGVDGATCAPRPVLAVGDVCPLPGDDDYNPCPAGSFCYGKLGGPYVCTKSAASGADCETLSKFACPAGETCRSILYPEFKCRPAGKAGGSCLNSTDCDIGLYCTESRVCKARKGLGSPCSVGGSLAECARYLRCQAGTCQPN